MPFPEMVRRAIVDQLAARLDMRRTLRLMNEMGMAHCIKLVVYSQDIHENHRPVKRGARFSLMA